jgi:predicted dehydrogenase
VSGNIRLGFLGAGNYASSMLLPHLQKAEGIELAHVVTTTSLSAANAQRRFEFTRASTDASALLADDSIDAVFVVTRHNSHAALAARALEAGKSVFVEKPLALSSDELSDLLAVVAATGNDRLMVGFNRRFAPMLVEMRSRFGTATGPAVARYLVNAGRLDPKSWYTKTDTEGSRFEGEGGHFIDTLSWWIGALPTSIHTVATEGGDDLLVTIAFDAGSIATVAYTTGGNPRFPKETFEVGAGGRSARLDNFRRGTVWRGRRRQVRRAFGGVDKGQGPALDAFLTAVRTGGPMPIPLASLVATTRATHAVALSQAAGLPFPV